MATSVTGGVQQITITVDNPDRDDLGGFMIWMSTTSGFTPGPANLVYNAPDLKVVLPNLTAGTTHYFRLALYSQIDPTDYDLSVEYSATPTAPEVNADNVAPGQLRGSHLTAGKFSTKGSSLVGATLAGAATVLVKDTTDFPASGEAVVFDFFAVNDRDVFSYTGKTSTSLTGCTGVLAHLDGSFIGPLEAMMVIDNTSNEMRYYGNRGDGTIEELASIGVTGSGTDSEVAKFGSPNTGYGGIRALHAMNSNTVEAALLQNYADGPGGKGLSLNGPGLLGQSTNGPGLEAVVTGGTLVRAQLALEPGSALPSGSSVDGDVTMITGGRMYVYDGTGQREVLKVEPSTFANVATGSTIALTAPPRRYVNTGAAKAALTFNLPASPVNGQPFEICTDNAITTVAIRDSAGVAGNVLNAPTTLAAGGFCRFEYRTSNTTWYRVG